MGELINIFFMGMVRITAILFALFTIIVMYFTITEPSATWYFETMYLFVAFAFAVHTYISTRR